jgi:uncharacterized protein DUF4062
LGPRSNGTFKEVTVNFWFCILFAIVHNNNPPLPLKETEVKVFVSSTFSDLVAEREAVLNAFAAKQQSALAMEYFLATSSTPLDTALENLRNSDVVILVIGFKAGSLLPHDSQMAYTMAEYKEAVKLGKPVWQ